MLFYFIFFRVIARYLSKVADFNLPHLHLAPHSNFAEIFGVRKLEYIPACNRHTDKVTNN